MRYASLDGLRGFMLVSMVMGHLGARMPLGATHGIAIKSGLINDAASAFVFISGLTVGLVYIKGWTEPDNESRRSSLRARTLLIFLHHLFQVIIVTFAALLALSFDKQIWIFQAFGNEPVLFGILSAIMLAASPFLDILPMYVLFMLLAPPALAAVATGRRWILIACVITAWFVGQTGFLEASWDRLEIVFGLQRYGIDLGLDFNRLSWSALFFTGLLLGSAYTRREFDFTVLQKPPYAVAALVSLWLVTGLTILYGLYRQQIITDHVQIFVWSISKRGLGFLALLNFLASAFLVTWLLVVAPTSGYPAVRALGKGLGRLLHWKPLVMLGQHSLSVFTFHIVGVYAFYLFVDTQQFHPLMANLIVVLGIVSLAIPVLFSRYLKDQKLRKLPPAGAGQVS